MRWFSFFAKFVFICNLCFLAGVVIQLLESQNLPQWLVGTLLVLGWFPIGTFINIVFLIIASYLLLSGKRRSLPLVITLLNIAIAIFQFTYFLLT